MIGYAFCGSFCTLSASLSVLQKLISEGNDVLPIMSERAYSTDTRFWRAADFIGKVEELCNRKIIHTVINLVSCASRLSLWTTWTILLSGTGYRG